MAEVKIQDALVERLFGSFIGAMDLLHVYVGEHLGLYDALAAGPLSSGELAKRCDVHERYAREWLEQQAVAGILMVDDPDADSDQRRFALPAEHAEVLLDGDSLSYGTPLSLFLASVAQTMPQVLEASRRKLGWRARTHANAFAQQVRHPYLVLAGGAVAMTYGSQQ